MAQQKPKLKTEFEAWLRGIADSVMHWIIDRTKNWSRRPEILKNNYDLGKEFLKNGQPRDAALRFKIVTWMDESRADVWYLLGRSYLADGDKPMAVSALKRALALKPDYEDAFYMLAMAGAVPAINMPKRMPLALAREYFEDAAADYNREQVEATQYRGHELLAKTVREVSDPQRKDYVVLDLGCGSGLLGPLVRDFSEQLIGVDFSPAMLAMAEKLQGKDGRKTYDTLIDREIAVFLPGVADKAFDVVLAAGVLSYIGDAEALFTETARVLRNGGIFAFTADKMDGQGFKLNTTAGRFEFSKPYFEGLATKNQLAVLRFEEAEVYPNYKAWLCVLRK